MIKQGVDVLMPYLFQVFPNETIYLFIFLVLIFAIVIYFIGAKGENKKSEKGLFRKMMIITIILMIGYFFLNNFSIFRKSLGFEIKDSCEADFDYDIEETSYIRRNPRLVSETHSITYDSTCRRECGLECQTISRKYQKHNFEARDSSPIFKRFTEEGYEYSCQANTCLCTCE